MKDATYRQFVRRWQEVTELPPQRVGPLTPLYKTVARHLKVMPWPLLVLGSLFVVLGLYLVFGGAVALLASVLQRGF